MFPRLSNDVGRAGIEVRGVFRSKLNTYDEVFFCENGFIDPRLGSKYASGGYKAIATLIYGSRCSSNQGFKDQLLQRRYPLGIWRKFNVHKTNTILTHHVYSTLKRREKQLFPRRFNVEYTRYVWTTGKEKGMSGSCVK